MPTAATRNPEAHVSAAHALDGDGDDEGPLDDDDNGRLAAGAGGAGAGDDICDRLWRVVGARGL
eukprot:scaffold123421_cov63-Phaeocystis_antarctica.AAC.4